MTTATTLRSSATQSPIHRAAQVRRQRSAWIVPIAFVTVLGAALQVQAQDAPPAAAAQPAAKLSWSDLDSDGNGAINRQEAARVPALAAMFELADADRNGDLTGDEYRAHIEHGAAGQASAQDKADDGRAQDPKSKDQTSKDKPSKGKTPNDSKPHH